MPVLALLLLGAFGSAAAKEKNAGDEPKVEIKFLIPSDQIDAVSKLLHVDTLPPSGTHVVCFYDTSSQELFNHVPTIILRSRYSAGGDQKTDSTVKIRGATVRVEGAVCEFDQTLGKPMVESWSVTTDWLSGDQNRRAGEGSGIRGIFTKEQAELVKAAGGNLDWNALVPFGPVNDVKVWKLKSVGGLRTITVERWVLPALPGKPERVLVEVSAKVPVSRARESGAAMVNLLGVNPDAGTEDETKTKLVLSHFASSAPAGIK